MDPLIPPLFMVPWALFYPPYSPPYLVPSSHIPSERGVKREGE